MPLTRAKSWEFCLLIKDLGCIKSLLLSCEINPLFVQHPTGFPLHHTHGTESQRKRMWAWVGGWEVWMKHFWSVFTVVSFQHIDLFWIREKERKRKEGKGRERKEWRLIWSIKLWTAQLSLVIQGGLVLGLMQISKSVDVQVPYTLVNFSWSSVPHDLVDTKGG